MDYNLNEIKVEIVTNHSFVSSLRNTLNDSELSSQVGGDRRTKIILKQSETDFYNAIHQTFQNDQGQPFQFSSFIHASRSQTSRYITADKNGVYQSVYLQGNIPPDLNIYEQEVKEKALQEDFIVEFTGSIFRNKESSNELMIIFFVSVGFLYLILAFQFENLLQPVLVLLTMPLGVAGGLFLLYITNSQLDLMAGIGFIVVLGIIVDDPILKIEMINRIKSRIVMAGAINQRVPTLEEIIHEAGSLCLKPLLLTSVTTTLALVPTLFTPGLGSELQKPMVLVIIGGLSIGILFTIIFIPLTYWCCYRGEYDSKRGIN